MTNYERIKNMSVEEMAEMFLICKFGCNGCVISESCSQKVIDYRPPNCYREVFL